MRKHTCKIALFLYAVILLLTATGCSKEIDFGFKELCYYHPHTAPVKLGVDWRHFSHLEQPTGMSVYVWPQNSAQKAYKQLTHNLDGITLNLLEGKYHSYVFNQSDTEFATIEFADMERFETAQVRVKQTKSSWYSTKEPATKIGEEPEWLAIDCIQDITVTEEMVQTAEEDYKVSIGKGTRVPTRVNELATLQPKSVIKKIDIYIHFDNIESLRSALGALENMAEGCYISTRETTSNTVTHTINSWKLSNETKADGTRDKTKGWITVSVSTFGLPAGHTGKPEETNLFVKLLLADNKTELSHSFPIGEILSDLNSYDGTLLRRDGYVWPQLHLNWPEPLPNVKEEVGGDGAFNVGVSGWGDEIVTILPM